MIEIIFKYNNKEDKIEYNEPKKLKERFEEYALKKNLDIKEIFLLYKGTKVNLETELYVEEQFNLLKIKTKTKLKFYVCRETPFQIIFIIPNKKITLEVKLNEKMEDILKRYSLKARINLEGIYFQYRAQHFSYENIINKTVQDLLNYDKSNIDKESKLMYISLIDFNSKTIKSIDIEKEMQEIINVDKENDNLDDIDIEDIENFEENLLNDSKIIEVNNLELMNPLAEKRFYLINFLILLIQYVFIISLTIVGFEYKINEMLIKLDISFIVKYIYVSIFFFLLSFIILCLNKLKKKRYLLIFHTIYPIFILYYGFLISEYIKSKYIIIGFSLVGIEIFSLMNNIIFNHFEPLSFGLFSGIISFIGLALFSFMMVKTWIIILYISIFWLLSLIYYMIWIFIIREKCKKDEYFYSSLIFNYGLFLGLSKGIIFGINNIGNIYKYIHERINDNNEDLLLKRRFYLNNFIILILQYSFIISLTLVGFIYNFNEKLIELDISLLWKYASLIVFIFLLSIIIAFLSDYKKSKFMLIFLSFFPCFIVYFSLLFSSFLDSKYIIISLSLIGIQIFSLIFNIILKNFKIKHFFINCIILSLIGLTFFSLFLIKSLFPILYISIFCIVSNGLFIFWNYAIFALCKIELDEFLFSVLTFNYNIFLAFAFLIKYCFNYIKNYINERIDENANELQGKKYFYLKNLIILLFQYTFIISLTIVGFIYKFNEKLLELDISLLVKYIPPLGLIFLSAIIILCLNANKKVKCLIIFHFLYPIFIVYYSLLISSFIDPKYIIIGLSLFAIQIFSMLFNALFRKFEIKHFLLFSSSLSLIGLLFFSFFWIKSWYPIIYLAIFHIISNLIYIAIIYNINDLEPNESLFSTLIFNYSIFLGIITLLYKIFRCFCSIWEDRFNDGDNNKTFKIFCILVFQYAIILLFVWLGYYFEWIKKDSSNTVILILFILVSIVNLIINCYFLSYYEHLEKEGGGLLWFCMFFYVLMMIIYFYFFVIYLIEGQYILGFVIILFFNFISGFLCIFLSGSSNIILTLISFLLSNIVSILLIHFLWLKNITALIWFIVLSISIDSYFIGMKNWIDDSYKWKVDFSIFLFNFGFFSSLTYFIKSFFSICLKSINNNA